MRFQAVLPNAAELKKLHGDEWERWARDYVWMGDWREAVRPDHYADDYLPFPAASKHFSHMPPPTAKLGSIASYAWIPSQGI